MSRNSAQTYLVVSATVFGLVAVIHLVRALSGWAFVVGSVTIPVFASWIGFILSAALSVWAVRLAS